MTNAHRRIVCRAYGQPSALAVEEHALSEPGPAEVRISVRAAGINFADVMAVAGIHQNTPPPPFTPGFEVAGVIDAVGEDVTSVTIGDRVMAAFGHGGYADSVVCPATHVSRIPDAVDLAAAATMPIAFGTAYVALAHRAALRPGEWLLVQGAGGNIGGGALQIGKLMGARTIATASGPENCDKVRALGADVAIDYRSEDVAELVRNVTLGQGVQIIFDAVTGASFLPTLNCLAHEGRHIIAGAAGGSIPDIALIELITRHISLIGVDYDDYLHRSPSVTSESLTVITGWLARGWLKPRVPRVMPLERATDALSLVASGKAESKMVLMAS